MSELVPWRRLGTRTVSTNPHWDYRVDRVALPDGAEHDYHYVHTPGSVMIVPVELDAQGAASIRFVRQYRHLLGAPAIELPGGAIKPGDAADVAARRELREETGCDTHDLVAVGWFNPCKGLTDERCEVFAAIGLFASPLPADRTEQFETVSVGSERLDDLMRDGRISDGMTLACLALARHHPLVAGFLARRHNA